MRSPLTNLSEALLRDVVIDSWGIAVEQFEYLPQGGGAYHWVAVDSTTTWFVTCDDLDTKSWIGPDRDTVFAGLAVAYGAAMKLRDAGMDFIAAGVAARSGTPAVRVDDRYCLSVHPFIEGSPGTWGRPLPTEVLVGLMSALATLHGSADLAALQTVALEVHNRRGLEEALDDLAGPWDGGPLSEAARIEMASHADEIAGSLEDFDRLAAALDDEGGVLTHGEPHPGNLLLTSGGPVLVDWDTFARARPERDLWMFAGAPDLIARYEQVSGAVLDPDALRAYRLSWALNDVVSFISVLRGEHRRNADTERALEAMQGIFSGREPAPYSPARPGNGSQLDEGSASRLFH